MLKKQIIFFVFFTMCILSYKVYSQDLNKSIVKVLVTSNPWDYLSPWQKLGTYNSSGSGCVIKGNYILTNAHVVSDNIFIQVQFPGDAKKYKAEPLFINNIADLAILKVKDSKFQKDCKPLVIDDVPNVLDEIQVYGFPVGGNEMSITKGVVSRMEFGLYAQSYVDLFQGQIDAAVNPGNSGGPVIKNGKIVGIVMQGLDKAQNTNYFIPTNIINQFLMDIDDGVYNGFPDDLIQIQSMENIDIRNYFKMNDTLTGALVTKILNASPCKDKLKVNDIILEMDGIKIDNDCKIEFRKGERTEINYILFNHQVNDMVTYKILRDGKILDIPVKLTSKIFDGSLASMPEYGVQSRYFIIAGILFQPLTYNLNDIYKFGSEIIRYVHEEASDSLKEIVIMTKILPSDLTDGYRSFLRQVDKVNGVKISDMKTLIDAFNNNHSDYHVIELYFDKKIILNKSHVTENNKLILDMHGIPSDRSIDLKQ